MKTETRTPFERALLRAGYNPADFAEEFGLSESSVRSHANGTRPTTKRAAQQYARLLEPKVPGLSWLMLTGDEPFGGVKSEKPIIVTTLSQVEVPEYNSRVGVKGGFRITEGTKKDVWVFSRRYLADELHLPVQNLIVFEVVGDSMKPTLESGDRVLVNISDKQVSQPGIFVLWENGAPVAKRIDIVPNSSPLKLVRISDNPKHPTREVLAERTEVIGRVVWYARRM